MKIAVAVDEDLLLDAVQWTGVPDYAELVRLAVVTLVQREVSRRLWEQGHLADRRESSTPRGGRSVKH